MPWCEIPPEQLKHIGLFGYDIVVKEVDYVWAHGPKGRQRIERARPYVWFEDDADAMQLGAIAIIRP
jgi:hypothetical protein